MSPNQVKTPHTIRFATARDLPLLPTIELAAAAQFRTTAYPHLADAPLASEHIDLALDQVWVVDVADSPVAFVIVRRHEDALHIHEIDVHPDHARCGLGAKLILTVSEWAAEHGVKWITLTTFDDVPWNAPYYTSLGFEVLPPSDWTEALQTVRRTEQIAGLEMAHRVCMRRQVP